MEHSVIRVSSGYLNTVNDSVVAGVPTGFGSGSLVGGQLGKAVWYDADQIAPMYSSAIGTLYGGGYRYVRLAAASSAIKRGQLLFWDNAAAVGAFQVTSSGTTTTDITIMSFAGFALNVITPGNYGWIQFAGIATGLYLDNITAATTSSDTGNPVFASTATAGRLDIFDTVAGTQGGDSVTALATTHWNRFIGWQIDPVEDATDPRGRIEIARMFTSRL